MRCDYLTLQIGLEFRYPHIITTCLYVILEIKQNAFNFVYRHIPTQSALTKKVERLKCTVDRLDVDSSLHSERNLNRDRKRKKER